MRRLCNQLERGQPAREADSSGAEDGPRGNVRGGGLRALQLPLHLPAEVAERDVPRSLREALSVRRRAQCSKRWGSCWRRSSASSWRALSGDDGGDLEVPFADEQSVQERVSGLLVESRQVYVIIDDDQKSGRAASFSAACSSR